MSFESERNDKQCNQTFTEMVAWHNETGRTGHESYRITQLDVDHHQEGSKRYCHDYIAANSEQQR